MNCKIKTFRVFEPALVRVVCPTTAVTRLRLKGCPLGNCSKQQSHRGQPPIQVYIWCYSSLDEACGSVLREAFIGNGSVQLIPLWITCSGGCLWYHLISTINDIIVTSFLVTSTCITHKPLLLPSPWHHYDITATSLFHRGVVNKQGYQCQGMDTLTQLCMYSMSQVLKIPINGWKSDLKWSPCIPVALHSLSKEWPLCLSGFCCPTPLLGVNYISATHDSVMVFAPLSKGLQEIHLVLCVCVRERERDITWGAKCTCSLYTGC